MTSHEIQKADLLDILFEGRNKQYGAYTLRRGYNRRLLLALGLALNLGLFIFLVKPNWQKAVALIEARPDLVLTQVQIPAEPLPPVPPPPVEKVQPPDVSSASFTTRINMVENPDPLREMQELNALDNMQIGAANHLGADATDFQQATPPQPVVAAADGAPKEEPRFVPEERSPEFPGGLQAWSSFLNRHLHTPDDLEPGEKKTVLVSFVVDAEGYVTGFKVAQSGGRNFDEEVIRVLRKMPRWKPAIQNGRAVAMPFTQPVTFVGVEQ